MSGLLVRNAPHLDGTEPIGVWYDAAFSCYVEMALQIDRDKLDALDELQTSLEAENDDGKPTMETWGTSEQAQRGQAAMLAMVGGLGDDMGATPSAGSG